jgi:hypothetical protein
VDNHIYSIHIRGRSEHDPPLAMSRSRRAADLPHHPRHVLCYKTPHFAHPLSLKSAFRARLPSKTENSEIISPTSQLTLVSTHSEIISTSSQLTLRSSRPHLTSIPDHLTLISTHSEIISLSSQLTLRSPHTESMPPASQLTLRSTHSHLRSISNISPSSQLVLQCL